MFTSSIASLVTEYPTSEFDVVAVWIAMLIFVPLSVALAVILVFIVFPRIVHISFNDAVELFLYACYLAMIMPIIYLGWKTVKQG
jgi:hypothetical protein